MPDFSAVGLFCEDIREEKTGQDTLVGILPDNMTVQVGAIIPKLCLYVRIHIDPGTELSPVSLRVLAPNDDLLGTNEFGADLVRETREKALAKAAPITGLISKLIWLGFRIREPGRLRALLRVGDEEILCGALNLQITPAPTVAEQQSEQSPAAAHASRP
jgi:hypothetical protein